MKTVLNSAGIYRIRNTVTGDFYVGSAAILRKRRDVHWMFLRRGKHSSSYLQRAYNKHGIGAFCFEVLIVCAKRDTLYYEQRFLDALEPAYNMRLCARSRLGLPHTEETKAKIGAAHRGKIVSAEARARIGAAGLGRISPRKGVAMSVEQRAKVSASRTGKGLGRILSEEQKRAIGVKNRMHGLGRKASSETRKRMSEAQKLQWKARRLREFAA